MRTYVPRLGELNTHAFSTNPCETLFGMLAQRLHYKPDACLAVSVLRVIEYLTHLKLLPDEQRGFYYPPAAERKRHYDPATMQSFSSGAADAVGSQLRAQYEATVGIAAALIMRHDAFRSVRAHNAAR